ncbi:MAG: low molecular weight phosphotyrosine protein phosphatase [Cellvibrionales bacterium TMED148]|nr:phosphotyrosine protein phosphatase [Porticoccaceae bacterium]RPG92403.1 MAG: low molecular weight phosphotyrosine protein phosphatase [Cellvibrionales bacterium TMED148]
MATERARISVLFVCLGNICRSPTAHGVFRNLLDKEHLGDMIYVDSAGTGDWHVGKNPDSRSCQTALDHGIDISFLRARLFENRDFDRFDYILVMDKQNLNDISRIKPQNYPGYLGLFLSFGSNSSIEEVPDPYYSGSDGFELVIDLVIDASKGLLEHIQKHRL